MSKLSDQAQAYIEAIGIPTAADIFSVKESTVALWIKNGNYPQKVHEAVAEAIESGEIVEVQYEQPAQQPSPPTVTQPVPEKSEFTMADVIQHLQNHTESINEIYKMVITMQRQPPAVAVLPGHQPTASKVIVRDNADGSRPSLVMQDNQFGSMVRVSPAIGPHGPQAPVVVDAEPSPVYAEPRNPDPNHWTKPKFIVRERERR